MEKENLLYSDSTFRGKKKLVIAKQKIKTQYIMKLN